MIRYEEIKPGQEQEEPDTALLLDEVEEFIADHVVTGESQYTAQTLMAAATWALRAFPTTFRGLWTAEQESAGKTTAMLVTASLSANPVNAKGTYAALRARIAKASNEPEDSLRTFYYDAVGRVYGASGLNSGGNSTLTLLLEEGYKRNATDSWSVSRAEQEFSIFFPVFMSGAGTSLPRDLRSRTIVIRMSPGKPRRYFDVRESEAEAEALGKALGAAVTARMDDLKDFRALGLHPRLITRRLEVWEPLFGVAWVLGGQRWLNKCRDAFTGISLSAEQSALTLRQQMIRDADSVLSDIVITLPGGRRFAGGLAIADAVAELGNPVYGGREGLALARVVAQSMPAEPKQVRTGGSVIRGYYADDIRRAWEAIRPAEDDAGIPEEENPFAVTDSIAALSEQVAG